MEILGKPDPLFSHGYLFTWLAGGIFKHGGICWGMAMLSGTDSTVFGMNPLLMHLFEKSPVDVACLDTFLTRSATVVKNHQLPATLGCRSGAVEMLKCCGDDLRSAKRAV